MPQARLDRWLGPLLLLLAVLWSWMVIGTVPAAEQPGEAGPRAFPLMMGVALGALALVMTGAAWRRRVAARDPTTDIRPVTARELRAVVLTFGLFCAYGFMMEKIGFLLATPLVVVLALAGILGIRGWRINVAMSLGLTAACFVIFILLMEAPLPRGTWLQVY